MSAVYQYTADLSVRLACRKLGVLQEFHVRESDRIWPEVKQYLDRAIDSCGGPEQFQQDWLVNVDSDILSGFSELGIM